MKKKANSGDSGGKRSRIFLVFYILAVYVITSYLWWGYLLYTKNHDLYSERVHKLEMESLLKGTDGYNQEFQLIEKKYKRQLWMILGEGTVFATLLILGIWQIRKSIKKEVALSNRQRNFMLSITHELRSPLASVKLVLETLLKRELDVDRRNKLTRNSLVDVARLEGLVDNILLASRIEDSNYELNIEPVNLSRISDELITKIDQGLSHQNIIVRHIDEDIIGHIDQQAYTSVLLNLLENAVKYSPKDTKIFVTLKKESDHICLEVADEGIGIPDSEKENVFEKFYRLGNEETRITKGTGLGLYITKTLVRMHRGSISLLDNGRGTIFKVSLPIEQNDNLS